MPLEARSWSSAALTITRLDQVGEAKSRQPFRLGLISDTHGVLCDEVCERFRGVHAILHAGDVGNHGGHEEVLSRLRRVAPVFAVAGNVDDAAWRGGGHGGRGGGKGCGSGSGVSRSGARGDGGCGSTALAAACDEAPEAQGNPDAADLPLHRLVEVAGWRLLVTHIVGQPPDAVDPRAAKLIAEHAPDAVVFGHSHKHLAHTAGATRFYNPGSAGPARFKLPRTAALLVLPVGGPGSRSEPSYSLIELAPRAPSRLLTAQRPKGGKDARQAATRAQAVVAAAATAEGGSGAAAKLSKVGTGSDAAAAAEAGTAAAVADSKAAAAAEEEAVARETSTRAPARRTSRQRRGMAGQEAAAGPGAARAGGGAAGGLDGEGAVTIRTRPQPREQQPREQQTDGCCVTETSTEKDLVGDATSHDRPGYSALRAGVVALAEEPVRGKRRRTARK